jgi:hypothetical protein
MFAFSAHVPTKMRYLLLTVNKNEDDVGCSFVSRMYKVNKRATSTSRASTPSHVGFKVLPYYARRFTHRSY